MHVIYSEVREVSVRLGRRKLLYTHKIMKREGWRRERGGASGDEDKQNTFRKLMVTPHPPSSVFFSSELRRTPPSGDSAPSPTYPWQPPTSDL